MRRLLLSSAAFNYALAVLSSAAVLGLALLLNARADLAVLPLLLSAVMVSAWAGGWGPGVVATLVSSFAADYFFMPPVVDAGMGPTLVHVGEFVLSGLVISGLTAALRRSLARARAAHAEARREIERRREIEDELRRLGSELERQLADRTEALKDAFREMDAFSYTLAHDLRAPLRAMGGFGEMLLSDYAPRLDDAAQDYARRVSRAALRMDRLIQDLLAYTRLSRLTVRPERVDLEPAFDAAMDDEADALRESGAVVRLERPLGSFFGSAELITGVLRRLLSNAVRFGRPGLPLEIRVATENRGSFRRLWVEDNGIGISEKYHNRLFRVFERLDPDPRTNGTGIGLAWVRRALERMGGSCGVESEEGRGSRFWIDLPLPPDESARHKASA